jgi:hypothetical protein
VLPHGGAASHGLSWADSKLSQTQVPYSTPQQDQDGIVAQLANEADQPVADVARLYDAAHAKLAAGAQVTQYLPIFVTRKVRKILRRRARRARHAAQADERPGGAA